MGVGVRILVSRLHCTHDVSHRWRLPCHDPRVGNVPLPCTAILWADLGADEKIYSVPTLSVDFRATGATAGPGVSGSGFQIEQISFESGLNVRHCPVHLASWENTHQDLGPHPLRSSQSVPELLVWGATAVPASMQSFRPRGFFWGAAAVPASMAFKASASEAFAKARLFAMAVCRCAPTALGPTKLCVIHELQWASPIPRSKRSRVPHGLAKESANLHPIYASLEVGNIAGGEAEWAR